MCGPHPMWRGSATLSRRSTRRQSGGLVSGRLPFTSDRSFPSATESVASVAQVVSVAQRNKLWRNVSGEQQMKRRIVIIIVAIAATSICASPQEALVVELSKEESAKATEFYNRVATAQKEWENYKVAIRDKYGPILANTVPMDQRTRIPDYAGKKDVFMPLAWIEGIEFSRDFRFAVPKRK
jgi:hypothetical protein